MRLRICVATLCMGLFTSLPVQGSKGVRAILSVAHVTRHGGKALETRIYVMHDHQYYLEVVNQEQPSPEPSCEQSRGVLSDKRFQRITLLKESPEWHSLADSSIGIGRQDGDFWYISIPRKTKTQFLQFSTEDKKRPDVVKHLVAWFKETEKLRPLEGTSMSDVQCSVFSERTADIWRR